MQVIDLKYLLEKKKVSYYERIKDSTGRVHEVKLPRNHHIYHTGHMTS